METVLLIIAVLVLMALIFYLGRLSVNLKPKDKKFQAGNLVVDVSDPLKDILSIELTCAIAEILEQDELYFKVVHRRSQEKPLA